MTADHQDMTGGSESRQPNPTRKPTAILLYHYMHPDEVVSGRMFDGLGEALAARGWNVEGWPCNRRYGRDSDTYPIRTEWHGVRLRRLWRPAFPQASVWGRILNAAWMQIGWTLRLLLRREPIDVVVVGTDPVLSVLTAIPCARLRSVPVVHWCFDLFPEAAVADGLVARRGLITRTIEALLRLAYASCRSIVDVGPCMRERLATYRRALPGQTLVPWALVQPDRRLPEDAEAKRQLFGRADVLGLLYSGSFGRAHACDQLLALAAAVTSDDIHFCFSVGGNMRDQLLAAVRAKGFANVHLTDFATERDLQSRLGAGDIHLVSLRESWTGTVVPSKFFAALAAGRPVIFEGSPDSGIARWIRQWNLGWVLTAETVPAVAAALRELNHDRARLNALQDHCHSVYMEHFARSRTTDSWDCLLRRVIGEREQPSVIGQSVAEAQEETVCTRS